MGDNRNLSWELGLPKDTVCPQCGETIHDPFDDYDVDCGAPNLKRGEWVLVVSCPKCNLCWHEIWDIKPQLVIKQKFGGKK